MNKNMINIWQISRFDESPQLLKFLSNSQNCVPSHYHQRQSLYNYQQPQILKLSFLSNNSDLKLQLP